MWSDSAERQVGGQILCNYAPPPPQPSIPANLHVYSGVGGGSITIPTNNNTQYRCKQTLVHKITNAPNFYMELILNGFEAGKIHYSVHWKGWALEYSTFLGPNGTPFAPSHFRAQKSLDFQGPPLPMHRVMDLARFKTITILTKGTLIVSTVRWGARWWTSCSMSWPGTASGQLTS